MGKTKRIFLAILLLLITCNGWAGTQIISKFLDHRGGMAIVFFNKFNYGGSAATTGTIYNGAIGTGTY